MAWSATRGIALTCAAVDDVTAWCLLAFVSSIVYARVSGAIYTSMTPPGMAAVIVAALLSALSTEYIGIHAIFGAFLHGAVIRHDIRLPGNSPTGPRIS